MQLSPWVRCECGKLHVLMTTGWGITCPACGRDLLQQWLDTK